MKFHKGFMALLAAGLFALSGASKIHAQDDPAGAGKLSQAAPATTPTTPEATPQAKNSSVKAELKELEEENQILTQRMQALEDKNHGGSSPDNSSPGTGLRDVRTNMEEGDEYIDSEGRNLIFSDPAGKVQFRLGGYMFADYDNYWQPNTSYLLNDYIKQPQPATSSEQKDFNGFEARKAHLEFGGRFDNMFGMSIGIESDKSSAVSIGLFHAFVYVKLDKALVFTAGKFSNVLSLEALQPSATLPFMEASMISNLVVNKDVGVMVSGEVHHFMDYAVEVANGDQDNESSATLPGKADQNSKAITGRLFFTPWDRSDNQWLKGLGLGVAGFYDDETNALNRGSSNPAENVAWPNGFATSLGGNEFAYDGGIAFADGPFYHLDGQGTYYNGPFGLQGEWVQSTQTVAAPNCSPVQLTNTAWLLEGTWVIGGEAGYEGPHVDKPFNLSKGDLGAFELVARVHQLSADVKSFAIGFPYDPAGSSLATGAQVATAYGAGVNWWFNENFKMMFDFERTDFSGGNMLVPSEQVFFSRAALIL